MAATRMNPLRGVAQGVHYDWGNEDDEDWDHGDYLGTCFAFRWSNVFLTAAHCVGTLAPSQLAIGFTWGNDAPSMWMPPDEVEIHPTADIAILKTFPVGLGTGTLHTEPFWNVVGVRDLGHEFYAFGFPADVLGETRDGRSARLLKGHVQRIVRPYKSHNGRTYAAAEMNIAAPAGLSGGPLFLPGAHHDVIGLVADNLRSTNLLEAVEFEERPGHRVEVRYENVITYGVALLLADIVEWLDERIPPRSTAEQLAGPKPLGNIT